MDKFELIEDYEIYDHSAEADHECINHNIRLLLAEHNRLVRFVNNLADEIEKNGN